MRLYLEENISYKKKIKKKIKEDSIRTCPMCGGPARGSYHHIIPRAEGGKEGAGNLVNLCGTCHNRVEEDPKLWARFLRCYSTRQVRRFRKGYLKVKKKSSSSPKRKGTPTGAIIIMSELEVNEATANKIIMNFSEVSGLPRESVIAGLRQWYLEHDSPCALLMGSYLKNIRMNIETRKEVAANA